MLFLILRLYEFFLRIEQLLFLILFFCSRVYYRLNLILNGEKKLNMKKHYDI
jgi:hypothetical protein